MVVGVDVLERDGGKLWRELRRHPDGQRHPAFELWVGCGSIFILVVLVPSLSKQIFNNVFPTSSDESKAMLTKIKSTCSCFVSCRYCKNIEATQRLLGHSTVLCGVCAFYNCVTNFLIWNNIWKMREGKKDKERPEKKLRMFWIYTIMGGVRKELFQK